MTQQKFRVYITFTDPNTEVTGVEAEKAVYVSAASVNEAEAAAISKFLSEHPDAIVLKAELAP
jgi:hypothetical protein